MAEISEEGYHSAYEEALGREAQLYQKAREFPEALSTQFSGTTGQTVVLLISGAMVGHSLLEFVRSLLAGQILLSVPLIIMALAGIVGLRIGVRWKGDLS